MPLMNPTNVDPDIKVTPTAMREIESGLLMKFELDNPAGSHKWRAARNIIKRALERGDIVLGKTTVIEKTGGNFGFGLALACRTYGVPVEVVIGLSFSAKKRKAIEDFGAKSIGIDKLEQGMQPREVIEWYLAHQDALGKSYYYTDQLNNVDGLEAHEMETGPEIVRQLRDYPGLEKVTFISSAGTGAHITGIARVLEREGLLAETVLMEPEGCDSRQNKFVDHALEGISVGVAPPLLDWDLIGRHETVSHEDMLRIQADFIGEHGYMIGNTSAACLKVAREVNEKITDKTRHKVLTLAYDHALWYI
ncbi:MAG: pyridoxal-phosphate dependent enzyme [Pseudomonadota bacterium]